MSVFKNISDSAKQLKILNITYNGKNGTSNRIVEPYSIKDGKLYAYCVNKQGIRAFNLNNIISATVTQEPYVPRWPIQI